MAAAVAPTTSTSTTTPTSTSQQQQQGKRRAVVFPVEDSDDCSSALRWAIEHVAKPGDVFHLAHVQQHCSSDSTNTTTTTSPLFRSSPPQKNPFAPAEDQALAARGELVASRAMISRRFAPLLEGAGVPHEVHLLEPPPSSGEERGRSRCERVGECLSELSRRLGAELVVVGGGGGAGGGGNAAGAGAAGAAASTNFAKGSSCAGSVTKYCLDRLPATVCVVRGDW